MVMYLFSPVVELLCIICNSTVDPCRSQKMGCVFLQTDRHINFKLAIYSKLELSKYICTKI